MSEQNEGYQQALSLLHACATEHGFVASPVDKANYHRVWGRDGSILSLAALLTDDDDLKQSSRRTLLTLAKYQGPHGEIPSNVDPDTDRISYGGTTGRVDADLWFLITVHAYWRATEDDTFLDQVRPAVEKVRFLLGCWEFNNRGLLFIPPTGDWADEYLQTGYVLYDQLLYYYAQCGISRIHAMLHDSADHQLIERIDRLKHLIQANYWFDGEKPDDIYHPILYDKGKESRKRREAKYWMPSFSPTGYSYRFDAFANILCSMLEIADDEQRRHVDEHLHEISPNEFPLVRAFHPVVRPADDNWKDLQMTFSYEFKNQPHEYHNGGLWPLLTGFYAADLAMAGTESGGSSTPGSVRPGECPGDGGRAMGLPRVRSRRETGAGGYKPAGMERGCGGDSPSSAGGEAGVPSPRPLIGAGSALPAIGSPVTISFASPVDPFPFDYSSLGDDRASIFCSPKREHCSCSRSASG